MLASKETMQSSSDMLRAVASGGKISPRDALVTPFTKLGASSWRRAVPASTIQMGEPMHRTGVADRVRPVEELLRGRRQYVDRSDYGARC